MQETVLEVIENHTKWGPEGSKIIENDTLKRFERFIGSGPFRGHICRAARFFQRHLVDLERHFGGEWISKGQSALCFSMFSAQSHKLESSYMFQQLCC